MRPVLDPRASSSFKTGNLTANLSGTYFKRAAEASTEAPKATQVVNWMVSSTGAISKMTPIHRKQSTYWKTASPRAITATNQF